MSYYLKLFDWALYTLPSNIPMADIEGDSHANDPASPDYSSGAPTWIGEDFTFNGGVGYQILINDDDDDFEDAYVETGGIQTLAQDVTINGTLYSAGSQVENEFSMVDGLGNEVWVLRIGGTNVGFVYQSGEEPTVGETFTATNGRDGDPVDSGDGVASAEPYTTIDSRDGTVSGSAGNDTINASYTGDPQGDQVDDGWAGGAGTNDNLIEALDGDDSVAAGLGADTVYGGSGNDTLDGGSGADVLLGETGDDLLLGGEGNDTLFGGDGNDTTEGGSGDDSIYAGAGADSISGGEGSDSIIFIDGFGHDTVSGGELGTDADVLDFRAISTGIDLSFTGAEAGSATTISGPITDHAPDTVHFSEIENYYLTNHADNVDGSASTSYIGIAAGEGNDTVITGSGNDIVLGGTGADSIDGGAGSDTLDGGAGSDTIHGGAGGDSITAGAGDDVVYTGSGVDTVETGEGSDTIHLDDDDDGGSNVLTDGGTVGTDTIVLATGAGTYRIQGNFSASDGFEVIQGSNLTGEILGTNDATANFDFTGITLNGVDLISGTSGIDFIIGSAGADSISGEAGNDSLEGAGGNDTIIGGLGADTIDGGVGNDSLLGGDDADQIAGGDGIDTIWGGTGGDYISGNGGTDYLLGEAGNDNIWGGEGNDFAFGGDGADTLYGGQGADALYGGNEADFLNGDDFSSIGGNDTLYGEAGDDVLNGNAGDDLLVGGAGNDLFFVSDGNDTISDFNTGNTGALGDGDIFNNDYLSVGSFYDSLDELRADQADDGVLNQSNTVDDEGKAVDYSDNEQFGSRSMTVQGADASSYSYDNTGVVCFTSGTMILTPNGEVPIESLSPGDMVTTLDNGVQPIAWIGQRHCDIEDLMRDETLQPVLIREGVLGVQRDLLVSRQHAMLVDQDHFARAIHLVETMPGVRIAHGKREVTYIHLMFDAHQIIFAEGAPSESFYPGKMAMQMMSEDARSDLYRQFPRLVGCTENADVQRVFGETARPFVTKAEILDLLVAA